MIPDILQPLKKKQFALKKEQQCMYMHMFTCSDAQSHTNLNQDFGTIAISGATVFSRV